MVFPEGFVLPPMPFLLALLVGLVGVGALLWVTDPPVTDRTVIAFAPWMALGSTLHVLYRIEAAPESIEVLFSAPSVYVTTAVLGGGVWLLGLGLERTATLETADPVLGGVGAMAFLGVVGYALSVGRELGSLEILWPGIAVISSVGLTALVWFAVDRRLPEIASLTGAAGALVVFGHVLDGISTAIGYDLLGASEEVPASQLILDAGKTLPTYELLGAGWLFVVVKTALAVFIVWMFAEFVREAPRRARLLLAFVAAVGLGPGVHNVLLFVVA